MGVNLRGSNAFMSQQRNRQALQFIGTIRGAKRKALMLEINPIFELGSKALILFGKVDKT
jgi:hypothetical protein